METETTFARDMVVGVLGGIAFCIFGYYFAFYLTKAITCGKIVAKKRMEKFYNGREKEVTRQSREARSREVGVGLTGTTRMTMKTSAMNLVTACK